MDDQEQYSCRNNLRISSILEQETEDIAAVTPEMINRAICQDKPITTATMHSLGQCRDNRTPHPVLLHLSASQPDNCIYKHRMMLNPKHLHEFLVTPGRGGGRENVEQADGEGGGAEAEEGSADWPSRQPDCVHD